MSAAGRNLAGAERHADDFYATPAWVTRAILPHVDLGATPLDPCCGDGAILKALRAEHGASGVGIENNVDRANACGAAFFDVLLEDALELRSWPKRTGVIMNPPFKLAMEFIQRALSETTCEVVALLRLAFLESRERVEFHRKNPADVFVFAQRPSFVGHLKWKANRCTQTVARPLTDKPKKPERCELEAGHDDNCRTLGTDSTAYAWFRWRAGGTERRSDYAGTIRVLDDSPVLKVVRP